MIKNNLDIFMNYPIFNLTIYLLITRNLIRWLLLPEYTAIFLSLTQKFILLFLIPFCIFTFMILLKFIKILTNLKLNFFIKIWNLSELTRFILLINNKFFLKISINDWTWIEIYGPLGIKHKIESNYNFNITKDINIITIAFRLTILLIIIIF